MAQSPKRTSRERMRAYRHRLRAQGLRPVTVWVPDLRNSSVREALREECRQIAHSADEPEVLAWIENSAAWPEREDDIPALMEAEAER